MRDATSPPREAVQTQLARIVDSRQFNSAPRLSRFLTYVVEQALDGQADRLKGYTIGMEVFDRGPDFDPQTDTIVRVQARALRQKLEQYYLQEGAADPVQISIAKGGYGPEFSLFDQATAPESDDASRTHEEPFAAPAGLKPSIAVLPFECIGVGTDCAFIGHGLTEGLISDLSRFRDLSVFSRSTTEQAKAEGLSIPEMFQRFHPDFVLEGSFRLHGDIIETRVRLLDAAADTVLLTDKIEMRMEPDRVYEAQDEMVARIAARIAIEYGPIGQHARRAARSQPSIKWETYAWISRYFEHGFQLGALDRREVEAGLIHAVTVDETSAEAHAALSMIQIEQYRVMSADCGDPKRLELAKKHAALAVRHDPQCALAHQAMALAYFHERRITDFRASVQRALHLNPGHSDMLAMFGLCFVRRAEWDAALPLLNRAIELNPLHPSWYHMPKAMLLMMTVGADAAIAEITKNPMPDFFAFHFILLWFHVEKGNMAAAEIEKGRLLAVAPDLEAFTARYFETIWLCDAVADRASAALRKVGLHIGD